MVLSVKQELRGCILLTGGLGFLGSVCLEQLLALTEVCVLLLTALLCCAQDNSEHLARSFRPYFTAIHITSVYDGTCYCHLSINDGTIIQWKC